MLSDLGVEGGDRECGIVGDYCRKGIGSGGNKFRNGRKNVGRVGARASKVLPNHILELLEGIRIDVKLPFEILTKFTLHSVDLLKLEHPLTND